MPQTHFDIIITGSGIVGATAALMLAKQTSLQIAVIDSHSPTYHPHDDTYDFRVSAISLSSQRIFQHINTWETIRAKRISPYLRMHVAEAAGSGEIHFDCTDVNEPALGYIIEDSVMRSSLHERFAAYPNIHFLHPITLTHLQESSDAIHLTASDQQIYSAKLLIAADGANSWVREQISAEIKTRDYDHTAIVATVNTTKSHELTAWQRFLPTGPVAFLPLQDANTASIVWSTLPAHAAELLALNETDFRQQLTAAFPRLGEVTHVSDRRHFPLRMRHLKHYVKSRIAFIGDAAHTIHPLAGQGVNLGLLDAACLAEVVIEAVKKDRDFASLPTLRRYERWRKGDNLAMLSAVEVLKRLFMSDKKSLIHLRNIGLNTANKFSWLKNFFIDYALGKRADMPQSSQRIC